MAESDYEVFDERFRACFNRNAHVEKLWSGCRWAEGPAYFPALRTLVWSDIPNDRMLRYDEVSGHVGVFREPCGYANGHTIDREGRLVSAEHGGRRISRTEHDGRVVTVVDRFEGKRLNSPNDVVVKSDGTIWFSDPPFGILSDYEGIKAESELGRNCVFRFDPKTAALTIVADDYDRPNGLAFSPDEKRLYVADSFPARRHIRVYDVSDDNRCTGGQVFVECTAGRFDGFRCDTEGRLWSATDNGVHCHAPDGTLLGRIKIPEVCSNVVFGGPKRNRLFVCATNSLYSILLPVNGAKTF